MMNLHDNLFSFDSSGAHLPPSKNRISTTLINVSISLGSVRAADNAQRGCLVISCSRGRKKELAKR